MKHIMLDIDGTLVESFEFDEVCFIAALQQITKLRINNDWATYPNVTDRGLLKTFIEKQAPFYELSELEPLVKAQFIQNIKTYLRSTPAKEVPGAKQFFDHVYSSNDYQVSIATGGWGETARMKLTSAGFDIGDTVLASSNDHHQRVEIMKFASAALCSTSRNNLTYFGDAQWDVNACNALGINLVIVGNRTVHHQHIDDFRHLENALQHC